METVQANFTGKKCGDGAPLTITIKRAQELSGLSRATINRMIWSGKLVSTTVGSRRLLEYRSFIEAIGLGQAEKSA